ncbi:tyrosine-type recombinase/integrase [Pseudomonas sp. NPDC086278]|uniref:tyrosine-type recombinase/integrase n=1 Tax=Pseudomonas sp. NPDC086278 TaxID=3390646 RepID=UPI003D060374
MKEKDESFDALIEEIESQARDAAKAYFAELNEVAQGTKVQVISGLLSKLKLNPGGDFPVSQYAQYHEDRWVLLRRPGQTIVQVLFNSAMAGSNDLKKVMVYHLIPNFHPFGTVRSFISTQTYATSHGYLEQFLLRENDLSARPEDLQVITTQMVNLALDDARDKGAGRAYWLLFFYINFWISLSEQKLIPQEYRLQVKAVDVNTKERQQDVYARIESQSTGWTPFSEDDLKSLLTYAFHWTEKAIPVVEQAREFLEGWGALERVSATNRAHIDEEFEAALSKTIDGESPVVGYSRTQSATGYYTYFWRASYGLALDKIRNGIFILFSLMTGLRVSELSLIEFDDVFQKADGLWYVSITRFKTASDPNYFGEVDEISIPDFLGEQIFSYRALREFGGFLRKGYLFQPVSKPKEVNFVDRMIKNLASNLSAEVGVDSIHPHRFRKTIAEMLINRSERNIDLIRMLFGHKSYKMSLRYIARNPYLVASIVEAMKEHYTADFVNVVREIQAGRYSGNSVDKLATDVLSRPELFTGKMLRLTVLDYVSHILDGGGAFFIQRTVLNTFCLTGDSLDEGPMPPCLEGKVDLIYPLKPDVSNCKVYCQYVVATGESEESLQHNIKFYRSVKASQSKLSNAAAFELEKKIEANERLLADYERHKQLNQMATNKGVEYGR